MLLPLCVHAVREQAERKLIRCDQSHAQDEASGEELCAQLEGGGGARSQSHKLISSRVVVAARLKILTPLMLFYLKARAPKLQTTGACNRSPRAAGLHVLLNFLILKNVSCVQICCSIDNENSGTIKIFSRLVCHIL